MTGKGKRKLKKREETGSEKYNGKHKSKDINNIIIINGLNILKWENDRLDFKKDPNTCYLRKFTSNIML